jgi:glucose-1-phosphate adenylyltransferase
MDPRQMLDAHIASGAGLTVAGVRVPLREASAFGIIETSPDGRIRAFREKPFDAVGLPGAPDQVLASMGNYIFNAGALIDAVNTDAEIESSKHDLGGSIVPMMVEHGDASWYDFTTNHVPGAVESDQGYWRDVGELDAYFDAHMDLISPVPVFNLYNHEWPIYTWHPPLPPAKFVVDERQPGQALDSLVSAGVIVAGATIRRSVLSPGVRADAGALVEASILMDNVRIGRGALVRNAILDKGVIVEDGARIGHDLEVDRGRFTVSRSGVVAVGKNQIVRAS